MAYSKRVYLTKVTTVTRPDPIGEVQVPYLATLPIDPSGPTDPYHWDVVYSSDGDDNGTGQYSSCFVGVYTTDENHAILEADPDITRIDDL